MEFIYPYQKSNYSPCYRRLANDTHPRTMDAPQLPDFDDLPKVESMPQGCAWGIFDKDGKKDLLGTLNLLTPSVVRGACAEARDGVSISLK